VLLSRAWILFFEFSLFLFNLAQFFDSLLLLALVVGLLSTSATGSFIHSMVRVNAASC
jgi:hypothetical protein